MVCEQVAFGRVLPSEKWSFLKHGFGSAWQCASEGIDHVRYLLRLAELELIERERPMIEQRINAARLAGIAVRQVKGKEVRLLSTPLITTFASPKSAWAWPGGWRNGTHELISREPNVLLAMFLKIGR